MKERIVTILLSAATTYGLVQTDKGLERPRELEVDRLVVRRELIVSDTGEPWETNYEAQQIPRGIYARSVGDGPGGLWVRSRLIKGELDDPFDDRFHALETNGSMRRTPGHISWNVWIDGAWRQMAIIQGEGVEPNELPPDQWTGVSHPGRIRIQSFRPGHPEPLTDALIGQGGMAIGGGGYGGGGLPYASDVLELWGGGMRQHEIQVPSAPRVITTDGSGRHSYQIVVEGPFQKRTPASPEVTASGYASLQWDSVAGGDTYFVLRDHQQVAGPLRIEGAVKSWTDPQRQ